jgi:hypothetical protein
MPLICDELSLWDISFRWAGYDPDKFYFSYPIEVKDNFRLLMRAIHAGEVFCLHLLLDRRPQGSKSDPKYYIRTHLSAVESCVDGVMYKKSLLKWAHLSRSDFKEWCERRDIPLPEFWFPKGWKYNFDMPEYGTRAFWAKHDEPPEHAIISVRFDIPESVREEAERELLGEDELDEHDHGDSSRYSQQVKFIVQKVAIKIWDIHKKDHLNPSQVARHEMIQKYTDAARYKIETVRGWVQEVAPKEVVGKRGRP